MFLFLENYIEKKGINSASKFCLYVGYYLAYKTNTYEKKLSYSATGDLAPGPKKKNGGAGVQWAPKWAKAPGGNFWFMARSGLKTKIFLDYGSQWV